MSPCGTSGVLTSDDCFVEVITFHPPASSWAGAIIPGQTSRILFWPVKMLLIEIIPDVGKEAGFAPERFWFKSLVCLLPHTFCPALATNSLSTHRI